MNSSFEQNPFQHLSAGGAIGRAVSLLFKQLDVFLPIGAICFIPILAMAVSMVHFIGSSVATASHAASQGDWDNNANNGDFMKLQGSQMGAFIGQFMVEVFLLQIVIIMAKGAIVYAVAAMYAQQQPTFLNSLKQGCSRWCDLFLTGFLVGIGVLICHLIVAFIIFTILSISDSLTPLVVVIQIVYFCFLIYVMVSFMILTPVIIVERKSTSICIWRCLELADGNRCFIFCSVFCIAIVNSIFQMILAQILFATHKDGHDVVLTSPILYCTVTTFTTFLYLPLICIMEAVVYFNIRVGKEGMNLEVLEGDMGFVANATYEANAAYEGNATHEATDKYEDTPKPELV